MPALDRKTEKDVEIRFFSEKTEKQAEIRALFLSFSFLQLSDDALDQ